MTGVSIKIKVFLMRREEKPEKCGVYDKNNYHLQGVQRNLYPQEKPGFSQNGMIKVFIDAAADIMNIDDNRPGVADNVLE